MAFCYGRPSFLRQMVRGMALLTEGTVQHLKVQGFAMVHPALSKGSPLGYCMYHSRMWGCQGPPHPQYNIHHPDGATTFCFPQPWLIVDSCGNVVVFRCFQVINKHKNTALQAKSSSYTFPSSFDLLYNCVVNGILPIFTLGFPKAVAVGRFFLLPFSWHW